MRRTLCLPHQRHISTTLTITDPLIKYQSLITTGTYHPDPAQHRLALHLQKVYLRLKDYTPPQEYREKLRRITPKSQDTASQDDEPILAVSSHPIWRNPLMQRLLSTVEGQESVALVRILTDHQAALEIDSPRGLFLSGEVGTGKSMLTDLLYAGLPTHRKRRWHFNTFMLYTFSQLEAFRKAREGAASAVESSEEYSLLWFAKRLVDESPILFLDEFQLPDRAASKLLSHMFIAFFQLGGVLVASSNRMPEELQKALGVEYVPPRTGVMRQLLRGRLPQLSGRGELFGRTSDFAVFLEVLKARCDFWHIDSEHDWRRQGLDSPSVTTLSDAPASRFSSSGGREGDTIASDQIKVEQPAQYYLSTGDEAAWKMHVAESASWTEPRPVPWQSARILVYGRAVTVSRHFKGTSYWNFDDLVRGLGPADYITLASTYHTFIVDRIPILTLTLKNEARRFITFLDALYEARCKLVVRAANPPDRLFFPDVESRSSLSSTSSRPTLASSPSSASASSSPSPSSSLESQLDQPDEASDATYSETIADVYQDQRAPFRPNVSYYDTGRATSTYDPDQDSDFVLEQDKKPAVDFGNTGAFTGEDERFAYKRAISRLWEMCSTRWHARSGEGWWTPLPPEARHWERTPPSEPRREKQLIPELRKGDVVFGPVRMLDEHPGIQGKRRVFGEDEDEVPTKP